MGNPAVGGSTNPWEIGAAISYGWAKLQANLGMLLLSLVGPIVAAIVGSILRTIIAVIINSWAIDLVLGFAVNVGVQAIGGYTVYRAVLQITKGESPTPQSIFDFSDLGVYIVPMLVVSAISIVAFMLCVIPGIIIYPLIMLTPFYALERKPEGLGALGMSWQTTTRNAGTVILFGFVMGLFAMLGLLACCVGVIFTSLIANVGVGRAYRLANGEAVA